MNKIEYREIGERFEYNGVVLQVEEITDFSDGACNGCYFNDPRITCYNNCNMLQRDDKKDVVYKLVEQEEGEKIVGGLDTKKVIKNIRSFTDSMANPSTSNNEKRKERVHHPEHYQHPSGVECITITRHHNFNIGNAIKYLWRQGLKTEDGISNVEKQVEDLKKAVWYINDEIERIKDFVLQEDIDDVDEEAQTNEKSK